MDMFKLFKLVHQRKMRAIDAARKLDMYPDEFDEEYGEWAASQGYEDWDIPCATDEDE